ncbi:MAG: heavy-metal-associated domain-containing protein, partial [Rhodothermales bacterium]|nr:heavy-metal-associated domain-containing protein [Rhodothermales bacterium]
MQGNRHTAGRSNGAGVLKRLDVPVEGMTCAACAGRIERNLSKTPGVRGAAVNYATERAHIELDPDSVKLGDLVGVIEKAGYGVRRSVAETLIPSEPGGAARVAALTARLSGTNGILDVSDEPAEDHIHVTITYV